MTSHNFLISYTIDLKEWLSSSLKLSKCGIFTVQKARGDNFSEYTIVYMGLFVNEYIMYSYGTI